MGKCPKCGAPIVAGPGITPEKGAAPGLGVQRNRVMKETLTAQLQKGIAKAKVCDFKALSLNCT